MKKLLLNAFIIVPALSIAQVNLDLESAIDSALQNNFEIRIARNYTRIAEINNSPGMAGGFPVINLTAGNTNSQYDLNQKLSTGLIIKKNDVSSHAINTSLSAGLILYNGLRVLATRQRLELLHAQSELELNQQIQNTIASVMSGYYDIIRQQSYLEIIKRSVDISLKEREIVQDRFDVGLANLADVLQAGMDLNMAEQNLASQQVFLDQQKINLLQLMGIRQFYDLTVNDSIIINRNLYRDSIMSYLETNPEYLGAWKQVKINEQLVKEIRAQRYPVLRLTTGYNYSYNSSSAGFNLFNQNYGPTLGASLQVPVFNGMIYRNQQDAAFINIENAELQKESIMLSLRAQALKTFEAYRSALEQIETQQKSYENAEKLVTLVLEKFKLSQVTILELKAAQASFENTAYRLVNLQFEAKIAEIELNRLTFRLGL